MSNDKSSSLARELGAIASGDTFLRLTADRVTWCGGEIGIVSTLVQNRLDGGKPDTVLSGDRWHVSMPDADLLTSGDWQRVPAGYTLPTVMECLAKIRVLVAARDRMRADPETGTKGVDDCITQMAAMAGMEVPA